MRVCKRSLYSLVLRRGDVTSSADPTPPMVSTPPAEEVYDDCGFLCHCCCCCFMWMRWWLISCNSLERNVSKSLRVLRSALCLPFLLILL